MARRAALLIAAVLATTLGAAAPAAAHQNPPDCNANRLDLDLIRDKSLVRNGDVINYTLEVDNIGPSACDVSDINIRLQFPGPDGRPNPASEIAITNAANYAAQFPKVTFGPFAYTVNANEGVTRLEARTFAIDGDLHDGVIHSDVDIDKTIGSNVLRPLITIDKQGSAGPPVTGPLPAPQDVTYTFYVRNGSTPQTPDAAISNVRVTDDKCGSPTYISGDTDGDTKLDTDETWAFQCRLTHPSPGTYTNVAIANGENILYNRPVPVVSPPDNWTVVLVAPPAPPPANPPAAAPPTPQGGVLPVNNTQERCELATARGVTVRAGEVQTIRVTARTESGPVANRLVRITLPGGRVVSARTNRNGVASLTVRPPRSGRATIRAGECTSARVTVREARRVVAQNVPRVTG